ncbi:unnamed protein product [Heligmosomoides polygyrus]|uniref:Uncharacterized protein n=1 Tax=Heligmosomoides polygyrus TaxID=6339 RepID=A0A183FL77_HELPZ|nr:unnamed protein product [Heligmosomoides polygyrus]
MCKCCLLVLALFCPCLAVLIDRGCGNECFATFLLSLFFYVPGVLFSYYVLLKDPPPAQQVTVSVVEPNASRGAYAPPCYSPDDASNWDSC